jgi:hypothetical protein
MYPLQNEQEVGTVIFLSDVLEPKHNTGYLPSPIPCERDREISGLLRHWMKLDDLARQGEASVITDAQRRVLRAYSERMASLGVRTRDPDLLTVGLIASALGGWRSDWRDDIPVLALYYDAAIRLGISANTLFNCAAEFLSEDASDVLRQFPLRRPADRSLEAMAYAVSSDAGGLRYVRTW